LYNFRNTQVISLLDISDIKDVQDPLAKVKAGLQGNKKEHIPLKSVHIRGKMMDMVAKVFILLYITLQVFCINLYLNIIKKVYARYILVFQFAKI
jgi:hypothetical protein